MEVRAQGRIGGYASLLNLSFRLSNRKGLCRDGRDGDRVWPGDGSDFSAKEAATHRASYWRHRSFFPPRRSLGEGGFEPHVAADISSQYVDQTA